MRAAIYTLGCKVNQYETQAMEKLLRERGHSVVAFSEEADAYVVNTCSVTAESDRKSRQMIRRIRRERPEAVVAVCGCYSQTRRPDARDLGADLIGGTGGRADFVARLEDAVADRRAVPAEAYAPLDRFEVLPAGSLSGRTRALLKVEDGCDNRCAYCVIPYARGHVRSLPLDAAVQQARDLGEQGFREIMVTGIEISSWGRKEGQTLADLAEAVCAAVPEVRIRLGSLEPRTVTEDFCRRLSALPNLCPHFHLSLQSGCDDTLRRMGRRYDTARYLESVELLRRFFPRPALTTDLITGFPGETEADFAQTLAFLNRCGFARTHVFPYSPRPGTPAAGLSQLPRAVREERARQAIAAAAETRRAYLADCGGERYPVLFEEPRDGRAFGRAPNSMEVWTDAGPAANELRAVRVLSSDGDALYGVADDGGKGEEDA